MDPNTKPSALTTGGGTQDPAPLVDPEADTTTLSCLDIEREARAGCPLTPDTARRHAGLARRGLVSPCESADLLERMADALEEAQRTTAGADWARVDRAAEATRERDAMTPRERIAAAASLLAPLVEGDEYTRAHISIVNILDATDETRSLAEAVRGLEKVREREHSHKREGGPIHSIVAEANGVEVAVQWSPAAKRAEGGAE